MDLINCADYVHNQNHAFTFKISHRFSLFEALINRLKLKGKLDDFYNLTFVVHKPITLHTNLSTGIYCGSEHE